MGKTGVLTIETYLAGWHLYWWIPITTIFWHVTLLFTYVIPVHKTTLQCRTWKIRTPLSRAHRMFWHWFFGFEEGTCTIHHITPSITSGEAPHNQMHFMYWHVWSLAKNGINLNYINGFNSMSFGVPSLWKNNKSFLFQQFVFWVGCKKQPESHLWMVRGRFPLTPLGHPASSGANLTQSKSLFLYSGLRCWVRER